MSQMYLFKLNQDINHCSLRLPGVLGLTILALCVRNRTLILIQSLNENKSWHIHKLYNYCSSSLELQMRLFICYYYLNHTRNGLRKGLDSIRIRFVKIK